MFRSEIPQVPDLPTTYTPTVWRWWRPIEARLYTRLVRLHGRGSAHQADYYRCQSCGRLMSWQGIRSGHGCPCGSNRLIPARLSRWEAMRLVLLPTVGVTR